MSAISCYHEAHLKPQGPGDARPTAQQIIDDQNLNNTLPGQVMLVTGCTNGIGIETARALHSTGADVYITGRNVTSLEKTAADIISKTKGTGKLEILHLDLNSLASVRSAAEGFLSKESRLNVLVCNAGIMAAPEGRTVDGFETQFGVNHLGHFLLVQLLLPALKAGSKASPNRTSRVVAVSSIGHRAGSIRFDDYNFEKDGYNTWVAYGQAKTANIWMANYIDRVYGADTEAPIHAYSLHPGGIYTNLQQHVDEATKEKWKTLPNADTYMKSIEQGAATSVFCAVAAEWEGKGGKYFSNCEVVGPTGEDNALGVSDDGHATWAYDPAGERKLWKESVRMVGLE
ncbi:putative short-chain dehydrogenase [Eremomyces bilateralis CBS 781.70]|uniref:Short-chain dehydrogenase n=1 Tax=Eremomyces bilateralis CBS 781.70 TaxID=1392243 RepID=A0A6G1FRH7_9PEZI|nr:putative short-chain dehydrogenase [Eremomyces bilateralis CBS 781.70]KAF1808387.1 putative short-chain dehydrogenase [Eremomyces bilateralis CBS 781.70]